MTEEFLFRFSIALAAKTAASPGYGEGFNCHVEVVCSASTDPGHAQRLIRETLNLIDHKSLGVDVQLGFEPRLPELAEWLENELGRRGLSGVGGVRLTRGDGFQCSTGNLRRSAHTPRA